MEREPLDEYRYRTAPQRPGVSLGRRLLAGALDLLPWLLLLALSRVFPRGCAMGHMAVFTFYALRDLEGGRLSPGKRLLGLCVVDARSGLLPHGCQGLARNGPYLLGCLLGVMGGACPGWGPLWMLATLGMDLPLLILHPRRRRLGDLLAGTRVEPLPRVALDVPF